MNPTAENPSPLLSTDQERELRKIARAGGGQNPKRVLRALVLLHLHEGRTVAEVAPMFFLCEKTVRNLRKAFRERGLEALDRKPQPPRGGKLTEDERQWLRKRLEDDPPRSARQVCQIVFERFGVRYSRRGAGNLMRRLGFAWNRPQKTPRVADEAAQRAFREAYRELKENLPDDEAVFFFDAVHPEHQVRPAHGWWREGLKPAVRSTSGRRRVHVLGALNLENGCGESCTSGSPTTDGIRASTIFAPGSCSSWTR